MNYLYIMDDIPWDASYKDTMLFKTKQEQTTYMNSKRVSTYPFEIDNGFKYFGEGQPIVVYDDYDKMKNIKYLWMKTPKRNYFFFVDRVSRKSTDVSEFITRTDVMQTYMFDYELGTCYVDREHQDRYKLPNTVNPIHDPLKPIYSLTDEGLDYGTSYVEMNNYNLKDLDGVEYDESYEKLIPMLITMTESFSTNGFASGFNYPSPFYHYLIFVAMEDNTDVRFIGDGGQTRKFPRSIIVSEDLMTDDRIVNISPLPLTWFNWTADKTTADGVTYFTVNIPSSIRSGTHLMANVGGEEYHAVWVESVFQKPIQKGTLKKEFLGVPSMSQYNFTRMDGFNYNYEPKLYTHPYFYINIFNNYANMVEYKNELVDNNAPIMFNCTINERIKEFLTIETSQANTDLITQDVRDLTLTNDVYQNFLRNNRHTALTNVAVPIATTIGGIALSATGVGAKLGVPMVVGGLMSTGGVVASDMARRADMKATPNSVRASGNNVMFDMANGFFKYKVQSLTVTEDVRKRLAWFWHMYGYKAQEFKTPNLYTRKRFNYVKTLVTQVKSSLNYDIKKLIEEAYERGIAFWHYDANYDDTSYFDYDVNNYEIALEEE